MHSPADSLDGHWIMVRAEMGGQKAPELILQQTRLLLAAGRYTVRFDGTITDHGIFEIEEAFASPSLILRGLDGPNAGRTIPCLFQHVGDRLRICYGLDGIAPKAFSAASGEERYLATYRRLVDS